MTTHGVEAEREESGPANRDESIDSGWAAIEAQEAKQMEAMDSRFDRAVSAFNTLLAKMSKTDQLENELIRVTHERDVALADLEKARDSISRVVGDDGERYYGVVAVNKLWQKIRMFEGLAGLYETQAVKLERENENETDLNKANDNAVCIRMHREAAAAIRTLLAD